MKYIANRPAKDISSLESQTIVPTLTIFGRLSECTRDVIAVPAVGDDTTITPFRPHDPVLLSNSVLRSLVDDWLAQWQQPDHAVALVIDRRLELERAKHRHT